MLARLGSGLALAAVAALALVGCSPPEPVATTPAAESQSPTPTSTEEELLQAAGEVYVAYSNAHVRAVTERTVSASAFEGLATSAQAEQAALEVDLDIQDGVSYDGQYALASIALESHVATTLEAIVCLNIDDLSVRNAAGEQLEQGDPRPLLVTFDVQETPLVAAVGPIPNGSEQSCP
ncbi:hypothetical protein FQ330_00745 [Agrococcus sediminis]|uniref:Uncharacterized protein n=1 Tax=Agrococcus sediminis TaxID=2599924 RepID=A0A5M8QMN5_9MICO|nr:hypothetical protein [Agrococcus sediminis]KAA6435996.1 hypothetical protein FQ330_00745 [Agrococcus sediminis]